MARKPRIHYEGALYHVIIRGNNREFVLSEDKWKRKYLELIIKYKERYGFKLYAYVIMDNHVHLLIEVNYVPLSKIMQGIQQVFTQSYNRANKRTGHVFEQRYKAILCDKDQYLLMLVRYIHQNPVRIYVQSGLKYVWSSYNEYFSEEELLVDKEWVLSLFDNSVGKFQDFMQEEENEIKGKSKIELSENIDEYEIQKKQVIESSRLSFDEVIKKVSQFYGIGEQDISMKTQQRIYVRARSAVIYLMESSEEMSLKALAGLLNISQSNVSVTLSNGNKRMEMKEELKQILKSDT